MGSFPVRGVQQAADKAVAVERGDLPPRVEGGQGTRVPLEGSLEGPSPAPDAALYPADMSYQPPPRVPQGNVFELQQAQELARKMRAEGASDAEIAEAIKSSNLIPPWAAPQLEY